MKCTGSKKTEMITAAIIVAGGLLAGGSLFYYGGKEKKEESLFKQQVVEFRGLIQENDLEEYKEYAALLEACEEAVQNHDKHMYGYLGEKLKEAQEEVEADVF